MLYLLVFIVILELSRVNVLCVQSLAVLICLFYVVNPLLFGASYDLENSDDVFPLSLTSLYWIFLMF